MRCSKMFFIEKMQSRSSVLCPAHIHRKAVGQAWCRCNSETEQSAPQVCSAIIIKLAGECITDNVRDSHRFLISQFSEPAEFVLGDPQGDLGSLHHGKSSSVSLLFINASCTS